MNKATHQGHCQACGRVHKLPSGALAKHGYTLDFGFFSGTCDGSGHAPLEESREYLEEIVQQCRDEADRLENTEPDTVVCDVAEKHAYKGRRRVRISGVVKNDIHNYTKACEAVEKFEGCYWKWRLAREKGAMHEVIGPAFAAAKGRARAERSRQAKAIRSHADSLLSLAKLIHGCELVPVDIGKLGD